MRPAALIVACALAAIVVAEAATLRFAVAIPGDSPLPDRALVVLVAAASLIVAVLALPRARALAWAAVTVAAGFAAVEVVTAVRALGPYVSAATWRDLSALAGVALLIAALVAVIHAGRDWGAASRLSRVAVVLAGAGVVATVGASAWAFAAAEAAVATGQLSPLRIAVRIGLATIAGGFLVGLAREVGPPVRRAFEQSRTPGAADGRLWRFTALLADELVPGRLTGRRVAAESERARLAADLHALVLPDLRRAAAAAEAAGLPQDMQVDLRRALEDVEQLMLERQSIVLEQFGLVAALEWLAERTEERSRLRVELELDGDVPDRPDAVDPAIARAAFRIALLALDNVVRHAGATTATLRVSAEPGGLRLQVNDDGAGSTVAGGRAGRGIADMRTAATSSGGRLEVELGRGGRVTAAWPLSPAASNHVTAAAEPADRPRARVR
jgi:signal transduction histidine kinase